jgi:hypothetical protein
MSFKMWNTTKSMAKSKGCSLPKVVALLLVVGVGIAALCIYVTPMGIPSLESITDITGGNLTVESDYTFMECTKGACCNGLKSNCDLKVDEVLFASAHNVYADSGFGSNHNMPLTEALEAGYRGLQIDICECDGEIVACHGNCKYMARDIQEMFTDIVSFLDNHKTEIIMVDFEMSVGAQSSETAISDVWDTLSEVDGLSDKVYPHWGTADWPVMLDLKQRGQQLILFYHSWDYDCKSNGIKCPNKLMNYFSYTQETEFQISKVDDLEDVDISCGITRGQTGLGNFYALNNFLTGLPSIEASRTLNEKEFLIERINTCEKKMKRKVNWIHVDFWHVGSLPEVTQLINKGRAGIATQKRKMLRWVFN